MTKWNGRYRYVDVANEAAEQQRYSQPAPLAYVSAQRPRSNLLPRRMRDTGPNMQDLPPDSAMVRLQAT